MEGVKTFTEVDEHYYLEILTSDIDVLAASYAPECVLPAVFVRAQGKGRVCVITLGHNPKNWANPQFQRILENALGWLSHTKLGSIPCTGIKTNARAELSVAANGKLGI